MVSGDVASSRVRLGSARLATLFVLRGRLVFAFACGFAFAVSRRCALVARRTAAGGAGGGCLT
jgi:hypothetical protein